MFCKSKNIIFFIGVLCIFRMATSEYLGTCINENCAANNSTRTEENETRTRVLSRSKRYLVFPDGSSLQLVFCCQTAALIPIGDIFLYGNTAALAWNLPTDPNFLLMLKDKEKNAQRRGDTSKSVTFVNENGKVVAKVPYNRPRIVNPAFAKRSVEENTFKEKLKMKIDRMKMHERQSKRDFLKKKHLEDSSVEFHRTSRAELYRKIESLITVLGGDGRQCVLYKLCESAQASGRQGTFQQEFLRVVFTLPKGKEFDQDEHKDYDKAHVDSDDCAALYPGCSDFQMHL